MKDNKRLDVKDVLHIARLARLSFSESEAERICSDMNDMIALADLLEEQGEADFGTVSQRELSYSELRDDEARAGIPREILLGSSPSVSDGYITVPRVVGEGEDL